MKIVVIGGTGLIGSKLVRNFAALGHQALPASPSSGVDILTGAGLAQAFHGAELVVDVSNSPSFEEKAVLDFFTRSTSNILVSARSAGVKHLVALSVVGTDRLQQSAYFRGKIVQEKLLADGPVPHSIVRATQFFEFVKSIADGSTHGGKVVLPPIGIQPIAAEDVASGVARVALGAPVRGIVEIAGPEVFRLDELVRRALQRRQDPREVVTDPKSGYFGAPLVDRELLPAAGALSFATRFDDWLTQASP
jgi:uncharacterized protein YbjT (DUF2867 family)